jgi:Stage II sporulation protein M
MTSHRIQTRSATDPAAKQDGRRISIALVRAVGAPAPVAGPSIAATVSLAGRVAVALTIACGVIALVVHAWFGAAARRWLAFPFAGIPARPGEAASIFIHNLRVLAAVGGLLLIAQSAYWTAGAAQPGRLHGTLRRLGEALLGAAVAANVIVIGASFGAYGTRMLRAALPHGPLELAAYSLALALYLQGRRRPFPARRLLAVMALSVSTLALAAVLETYVNL